MAFKWCRSLYREFMLSLSESFSDVKAMGNKKTAKNLSDWAKKKAEKGGNNNG